MKNTPLQSVIDDSLDHMFVVDKHGQMVFFPWGGNKQGYYARSKSLVAKVKKFYRSSFFICLIIFIIAASLFNNFWGIIGSMFISFVGWYLAYYLYASHIVKSLPVAKTSYQDIVLEKLEPEGEEEASQADVQFPAHWNQPVPQTRPNGFARIQHLWYRLSPGQVFMACFFVSIFTALLWSKYRPEQWIDADYFVGFLVCLLLGYGGFVVTQHMKSTGVGWFELKQIRLSMAVIMLAGWSFAAWFLFKFVVSLVAER